MSGFRYLSLVAVLLLAIMPILAGLTLDRPETVSAVTDSVLAVGPTTRAGASGKAPITQGLKDGTVHRSERNTGETFNAIIPYRDDQNSYGSPIHRKWYVAPLDTITNHCDNATAGSLAWVRDQIGMSYATVELPGNHQYDVTDNCTIPSNIQLVPQMGAVLKPSSGKAITFSSPAQILAGKKQQIISGSGKLRFLNPGTVYIDWRGRTYADINATIEDSVPVNSTVVFGDGNYTVGRPIFITKGIDVEGTCGVNGTKIIADKGLTGAVIKYAPASPYFDHRRIQCLNISGGNQANLDGLELINAAFSEVNRVRSSGYASGAAFHLNGTSREIQNTGQHGNLYLLKLKDCVASGYTGYKVDRDTSRHRVFTNITIEDSYAVSVTVGLYATGGNTTSWDGSLLGVMSNVAGFEMNWINSSIESVASDGVAMRVKDGAHVNVRDNYLETASGALEYWLTNYAHVEVTGGHAPTDWSRFEDNSTLCFSGPGTAPYPLMALGSPVQRQCVGDRISDKLHYGSPNHEAWTGDRTKCQAHACTGWIGWKGLISIDSMGNRWLRVSDDQRGEGGYDGLVSARNQFAPLDGRIIIPVSWEDLNHQAVYLYWSEVDFVVTGLDFVITESFVHNATTGCDSQGGPGVMIGTTDSSLSFDSYMGLQSNQGAAVNLTAGRVIRAWDNNDTAAGHGLLSWVADPTTHRAKLMKGARVDTSSGWERTHANSYIVMRPCPYSAGSPGIGSWSAGSGYVIITGHSLKYN